MKFCSQCGKELVDEAVMCPVCGCSQKANNAVAVNDSSSIGYGILGFFIPLVGLILFLVWKPTTPLRAKSAGIGALIGFILGFVSSIIISIIVPVLTASLMYAY